MSGADGQYALPGLPPDEYVVREVVPTGHQQTSPGAAGDPDVPFGRRVVIVPAAVVPGIDFGNTALPSQIRGLQFEDLDGDAVRDAEEPLLAGVTVYVDVNRNGQLDATEPSAITDAAGQYVLADLPAGEHIVRAVSPAAYRQTYPVFEGPAYYGVGVQRGSGQMQLLKIDAATRQLTWLGTPSTVALHDLVRTNSGELFGLNGPSSSLYAVNPATAAATLVGYSGYQLAWGLTYDSLTDTIYGLAHTGNVLSLATFDRKTGRATPVGTGIAGLTGTSDLAFDTRHREIVAFDNYDDEFYAFDLNGNGRLLWDTSNIEAYSLAFNGQHFVMELGGSLRRLDPYTQQSWGNLVVSPAVRLEALDFSPGWGGGQRVVVGPGETVDGRDFGQQSILGEIRGTKFEDLDEDGSRDAGDRVCQGCRVSGSERQRPV